MSNSLEQSSDHLKGTEVFVGGLAPSVTEGKIREVFSACGEIMDMRLIKDQKGSTKGFGFVRFVTKEAADKAVKELSGTTLEGKKIGVLPSTEQDTLFIGNLYKGWSADDFDKFVRQVFPDVVSVDLALPSSSGVANLDKKKQNRGFAFVKFSSHAAAARAYRVGSKPDFLLGSLHPSVEWAEDDTEVDPKEQAKIKIAFIRNLPLTADEKYLKKLFMPFGKVEKVVVSRKEQSSVGFVHFSQRSELDRAIEELNGKTIPGSKGIPSFKLQVEVARPMEKKKKRGYEELQSKQPGEVASQSKFQKYETTYNTFGSHEATIPKVSLTADPYEASVLLLPATVKERLLRILRLGIATRFDIDIHSLTSLKEIPESSAISVLDQFMLSGADKPNKGAYLAGLISKYQVDKFGFGKLPLGLSRTGDVASRESGYSSLSGRIRLPAVDSLGSYVSTTMARPDSYGSRFSSLYSDYPSRPDFERLEGKPSLLASQIQGPSPSYSKHGLNSHLSSAYGDIDRTSPIPSYQILGSSSLPYGKVGVDSHIPASSDAPKRPQLRFDPFTGQPYKFDPFTGEPILPESTPGRYGSPY